MNQVLEEFYLTEPGAAERLTELTGLDPAEIANIVGRFRADHFRFAGLLRGQVRVYLSGDVEIVHHFKKTTLLRWEP